MGSNRKKRPPSVDEGVDELSLQTKPPSGSSQRKQSSRRKKIGHQSDVKTASTNLSPSQEGQDIAELNGTGKDAPGLLADAEAATESPEVVKERDARERMFAEFAEEHYDIVQELPLELDRNFTLIGELEASVEECKQELHEDLREYLNFAQRTIDESGSEHLPLPAPKTLLDDQDIENRLLTLAQPMLWGIVPITSTASPAPSTLPDHFKSLLSEISKKMCRLHKLSRDKLNLAETVYEGLDRHLKRLDADLEKYQDLEDEDQEVERRHEREDLDHARERLAVHPANVEAQLLSEINSAQTRLASESISPDVHSELFTTPSAPLASSYADASGRPAVPPSISPRIAFAYQTEPNPHQAPPIPRAASLPMQPASGSAFPTWPDTGHSNTQVTTEMGAEPTTETRRSSRSPRSRRATSTATSSSRRASSGSRKKLDVGPSITKGSMLVPATQPTNSQGEEEKLYCYCKQVSYGDMVACDNIDCEGGEWFHLECTGLSQLPDVVDWYCNLCMKKLNRNEVVKNRKNKRKLY